MRRIAATAFVVVLLCSGCAAMVTDPGAGSDVSAGESTYAPIESRSFSGVGDDVIDLGDFTDPAILHFGCASCTDNTVVKTDGREGLLVNTIGSYSGSHFINLFDGSMTSRITVEASGSWNLVIDDASKASHQVSGQGDTALVISDSGTKATITNRGESNFVVHVYGFDGVTDLAINEIGSYQGTVPFDAPALVQVESSGTWSIDLAK